MIDALLHHISARAFVVVYDCFGIVIIVVSQGAVEK